MIHLISEEPLKYEDDAGNEVEIEEYVCTLHGGVIKYVIDNGIKVPVFIPASEETCLVWRDEFDKD